MSEGGLRLRWLADDARAEALAERASAEAPATRCAVAHAGALDVAVPCSDCTRLFAAYEAVVAVIDRAARMRLG